MESSNSSLSPSIKSSDPPPFYEMSDTEFEEMCRDIMSEEPSIGTCEIYGDPGQSQEGIDVIAFKQSSEAIEVVQCKCYEDFPPRKIREASDKFFEHLKKWKKDKVKRFILCVGSELKTRQRITEIKKQKKRFKQEGIEYEAWSASRIRQKLRPHRGIVRTYLETDFWVEKICGALEASREENYNSKEKGKELILKSLIERNENFEEYLSTEIDEKLKEFRELWRSGKHKEAYKWVRDLQTNRTIWNSLEDELKAKLIRFQASITLSENNDVKEAKELAEKADQLVPPQQQKRLKAIIAQIEEGANKALKILEGENDIDSLNIKIACYLELEKIDEVREIIENDLPKKERNADTFRLISLYHFYQKDLEKAELNIDKGLQISPEWKDLLFLEGVIKFYKATLSEFIPSLPTPWPEPISQDFVKTDEISLQALEESRNIFSKLIDREIDKDEKQNYEAWQLATLILDPNSYDQSLSFLNNLVDKNPTHYQAIIWGIVSRIHFNIGKCISALKRLLEGGNIDNPNYVIALTVCYLEKNNFSDAEEILEEYSTVFKSNSKGELQRLYWLLQTLILDDREEEVLKILEESEYESDLFQIKKMALRSRAIKTEQWESVCELLLEKYGETDDIRYLLEYCGVNFQNANWQLIIQYSETLLNTHLSLAIRYVYLAYLNVENYDKCHKIVREFSKYLDDSPYKTEKTKVETYCKFKLGYLPDAINDAELLVRDDPTSKNLLNLVNLYISKGDITSAVPIAKKLSKRDDLPAFEFLSLAGKIEIEAKEVARDLWYKAKNVGIPEKFFGFAIQLAYKLGIDDEASKLLKEIDFSENGEHGFQALNFNDLLKFESEKREQAKRADQAYRDAKIPFHTILSHNNGNLAEVYYLSLVDQFATKYNPTKDGKILIRHGGKNLNSIGTKTDEINNVTFDITSLIIAHGLNILDEIEESLSPIKISFYLIQSLMQMREAVQSHQPSRLESYKDIIDLIDTGKINILNEEDYDEETDYDDEILNAKGEEWAKSYNRIIEKGGYRIEYFPLTDHSTEVLSSELKKKINPGVIGLRSIIESLERNGTITPKERENYINALQSNLENEHDAKQVAIGTELFTNIEMLITMSQHEIIDFVCSEFEINISERDYSRVKSNYRGSKKRSEIDKWIKDLVERINEGIDEKTYKVIPQDSESDLKEDNYTFSPLERAMNNVVKSKGKKGDFVVCDDRFINKHLFIENQYVTSIVDLLYWLENNDNLSTDKYFKCLTSLRRANFYFIPFSKAELIYQLKQSKTSGTEVVETRQLKVLRRYHASSFIDDDLLILPDSSSNVNSENFYELSFLKSLFDELARALFEIWEEESIEKSTKVGYSNWLINNFYYDHFRKSFLQSEDITSQDLKYGLAVNLLGYLTKHSTLIANIEGFKSYMSWLSKTLIDKKLIRNPGLTELISDRLKDYFQILLDNINDEIRSGTDYSEEEIQLANQLIFKKTFENLSPLLKNELEKDGSFLRKFGYEERDLVSLGGFQFPQEEYWPKVQKAINGITVSLQPYNLEETITFHPLSSDSNEIGFEFKDPSKGKSIEVKNDFHVWCLVSSFEERKKLIKKRRELFDLDAQTFDEKIDEICGVENVTERVNELYGLLETSPTNFYWEIEEKLRKREEVNLQDLFPEKIGTLLKYYRYGKTTYNKPDFLQCLSKLAEEDNTFKAFSRFSGIPVKFSDRVIKSLKRLDEDELRNVIKRLINSAKSPVSFIQIIYFLRRLELEKYTRLSNRLVSYLFSERFHKQFVAFKILLEWVHREVEARAVDEELDNELILLIAWGHTSNIFSIFIDYQVSLDWIIETFKSKSLDIESFFGNEVYKSDIADPQKLRFDLFLISALGYCFNNKPPTYLQEKYKEFFTIKAEDEENKVQEFPDPVLYLNTDLGKDCLGSFIGINDTILRNLFEDNIFENVQSKKTEELAEELIDALYEDPINFSFWLNLYYIFGTYPLPQKLRKQLEEIIAQISITSINEDNIAKYIYTLSHISSFMMWIDNEKIRTKLREELFDLITHLEFLADNDGMIGEVSNQRLLLITMDILLKLSNSPSKDDIGTIKVFDGFVKKILEECPSFVDDLRPMYENICYELPISKSRYLIPTLMEFRAIN